MEGKRSCNGYRNVDLDGFIEVGLESGGAWHQNDIDALDMGTHLYSRNSCRWKGSPGVGMLDHRLP